MMVYPAGFARLGAYHSNGDKRWDTCISHAHVNTHGRICEARNSGDLLKDL